jgi:hypothetical protein
MLIRDIFNALLGRSDTHSQFPEVRTRREAVLRMTISDARQAFFSALSEGDVFDADEDPSDAANLAELAPELQSLLTRYREIRKRGSDIHVTRDMVSMNASFPDFILVGEDLDGTIVAVKPEEEPIFIFDGEDEEEQQSPLYPSVYHWLLDSFIPAEV